MPPIHRIGDKTIGICHHGADCCPHTWVGIRVNGSADTRVNGQGAGRVGDIAVNDCPHCGIDTAIVGSGTVFVNGIPVHRSGDMVVARAGTGVSVGGSPDTEAT